MKNIEILKLKELGVLNISAHCLDSTEAYKVVLFRRSLRVALDSIITAEQELLGVAGIDDPVAFDKELDTLRQAKGKDERQLAVLSDLEAKLAKYRSLREKLMSDDAPDLKKPLFTYERWKLLQDENCRNGHDPLSGLAEDLLHGIMWVDPDETTT